MESQPNISASTIVYLFAEQFAEPARGLTAQGAIAPRTGAKVNVKPLALAVYQAAVMELVESGAARLETIEVKRLLGKDRFLALASTGEPRAPLSALAMQLLRVLRAAQKDSQRRVRELVIQVMGGRGSTYHPWLVALAWPMGEAEAGGMIQRPEKKPGVLKAMFKPTETLTGASAVPECVEPLAGLSERVRARLAAFEQSLGPDGGVLRKEIEKGIDECAQRSDD